MRLSFRSFLHMTVAATIARAGTIPHAPRISHLILDFDETLTTHDTIDPLATAAYSLQAKLNPSNSIPPWSFFTDSYGADYDALISSLPPASSRTSVRAEFQYLASLCPVERASIERIESHGVFANLPIASLSSLAPSHVTLRPGWFSHLVRPALSRGVKVSILSVNWSTGWIIEALRAGAISEGGDEESLDGVEVMSNDLVVDEKGVTTGKLTRWFEEEDKGMWTAREKRVVLDEYLECGKYEKKGGKGKKKKGLNVYVGDSSTDLEAMWGVDVGVYIGSKMVKTLERIGVDLVDSEDVDGVKDFLSKKKRARKPKLLRVDQMEQLGKFLGFDGEAVVEEK
ncbi:hypothetical protein EX30DRAFT_337238 [Ascodesmis nigricans]|uniref:HAD-like protein n=1 Tax=Ascodesmis nigricans TaxID=341454 RepID=A0A4V3SJN8_9PEZI|nr:hypothetical protein EX30DRAFT_337238 [Ascodesmis nigricans]